MYIHPVVEQGKSRVGVAQAVERSVLPCTRACNQPCIRKELTERLVDVFGYGSIGQSKHGQIDTLLEQVFKGDVAYVFTAFVYALEVVDGATAADDVPATSLTRHAHLQILQILFLKQRHMLPA